MRQRGTKNPLRDNLNCDVQPYNERHPHRQPPRNGARRFRYLAARGQGRLHAGADEERENHSTAESRSAQMYRRHKIGAMHRAGAGDHKNRDRNQFQRSCRIHQPRPARHAAGIHQRDAADHADDHRRMNRPHESRRHHGYSHVGKGRSHTAACKSIAQPQHCAGDIARQGPKSSFDIAVGSAAGRHPAATLGKAKGHCSDRHSADQKGRRGIHAH